MNESNKKKTTQESSLVASADPSMLCAVFEVIILSSGHSQKGVSLKRNDIKPTSNNSILT